MCASPLQHEHNSELGFTCSAHHDTVRLRVSSVYLHSAIIKFCTDNAYRQTFKTRGLISSLGPHDCDEVMRLESCIGRPSPTHLGAPSEGHAVPDAGLYWGSGTASGMSCCLFEIRTPITIFSTQQMNSGGVKILGILTILLGKKIHFRFQIFQLEMTLIVSTAGFESLCKAV